MGIKEFIFGIFGFILILMLGWLIDAIRELNTTLKQIKDKLKN